jgi:hypothetical protein
MGVVATAGPGRRQAGRHPRLTIAGTTEQIAHMIGHHGVGPIAAELPAYFHQP